VPSQSDARVSAVVANVICPARTAPSRPGALPSDRQATTSERGIRSMIWCLRKDDAGAYACGRAFLAGVYRVLCPECRKRRVRL